MSSENREATKRGDKKGRRNIVLFFLCGTVLFGVIGYIWYLLKQPSIGTITVEDVPVDLSQTNEIKLYTGQYISFSYPGAYYEKSHTVPEEGPIREHIALFSDGMESRRIAIAVEERPEQRLDASPSFQMRMRDPKQYRREISGQGNEERVIFIKDSQVFEVTAFFMKKNLLVSVSATSSLHLEGLSEDVWAILETM